MARPVAVELDEFIACVEDSYIRASLVRAFAKYLEGPHVATPLTGWVPRNKAAMDQVRAQSEVLTGEPRVTAPTRSLDFDDLPDPLGVQRVAPLSPPTHAPAGVHWNPELSSFFYDDRRGSCGQSFYYTWYAHRHLFPQIEGRWDVLPPQGETAPRQVPDRRDVLVNVPADVDGLFAPEEPAPWSGYRSDQMGGDRNRWRQSANGQWWFCHSEADPARRDDDTCWEPISLTGNEWLSSGPTRRQRDIRWPRPPSRPDHDERGWSPN